MSDPVLIAIIAGGASILPTIFGMWNNALARRNARHIEATRKDIAVLEKNTNSIKDALVKVTGEEAFARGMKEGHAAAIGPPGPQGETGATGPRGKSA